jgi:hypothetical protein
MRCIRAGADFTWKAPTTTCNDDIAARETTRSAHLHRVCAAGNGEDGALEEVVAELLGVQRRARDDQLQILALLDHALDDKPEGTDV